MVGPKKSPPKKSPGRTRSPGRPANRTLSKSPSRGRPPATREKSKSPARTTKTVKKSPERTAGVVTPTRRSPIRRSPGRPPKTTEETKIPVASSSRVKKQQIVIETDTDSDTGYDEKPEVKEKPKATVRGRTRIDLERDQVELQKESSSEPNSLLRRVTRSSQSREVERIVHVKHFDTATKKLGEFSDEDELHLKKSVERESDKKQLTEFGGPVGVTLSMILLPAYIIWLHMSCDETSCSFLTSPAGLRRYKLPQTWFDLKSFMVYLGYFLLLSILSALPVCGKKVSGLPNKHGKLTYVANGPFVLVLMTILVIVLEIRNVPVMEFIVDHEFHLCISALSIAVLLSVYAYIRSFYVPVSALNTHTVGQPGVYSFFMGKEINPRPFGIIDLKMFILRLALIGSFLIDFAFMYKSLGLKFRPENQPENSTFDLKSLNLQPAVMVYFLIHNMFHLDTLIFEHTWITTFENQQEGFGYMSAVVYSLIPFMGATQIRYLVDYGVQLAAWKLGLIVLVFLIGYILLRGSNNQKYAFRMNPYSPAFAHMETIPTTQGKKLLCSGFWGLVRHPNYLGDILIQLSFVPFVYNVPPVTVPIFSIILLIHRTSRDHVRCKQKYGSAWDRYCSRVKYSLVPKVF